MMKGFSLSDNAWKNSKDYRVAMLVLSSNKRHAEICKFYITIDLTG